VISVQIDEREIVRRFNAARTPQQLADLLRNPSPEEERALKAFLGEAKFDRLRSLAYSLGLLRGGEPTSPERNVVVLPGVMGSELNVLDNGASYNLWLDLVRIGVEGLDKLKLGDSGLPPADRGYQVVATGLLIKYYGEVLLKLGARWNVRPFPYDWRSDLDTQAAKLLAFIRNEFAGRPVSIVAHSMGGLLSRALIRLGPRADSGDPLVRRLVMLGTPNFGSFEVPLILAGIQDTVRKLTLLTHPILSVWDRNQARLRVLQILSTFPGVYQMLPRKGIGAAGIRKAEVFRTVNPYATQAHIDRGVRFLDSLESTIDPKRMSYVAGYGFDTIVGVDPGLPLDRLSSYWSSKAGDGTVPHELGLLKDVPTYYTHVRHADLPADDDVIAAVDEILDTGATRVLRTEVDSERSLAERSRPARRDEEDERAFAETAREFVERARSVRGDSSDQIDPLESVLADELLSAWVSGGESRGEAGKDIVPGDRPAAAVTAPGVGPVAAPVRIRLRIVPGNIAHCHDPGAVEERRAVDDPVPIDAVAVGIYENWRRAWGAIREIDLSIDPGSHPTKGYGLLSGLIARGAVRGELGIPTLIPDPRPQGTAPPGSRHIVLVGMGVVGRFGVSEAMRTARETAWYLGRVRKKHLATLLIGAGTGNLSPQVGMRETLRGIARAVNEARSSDPTTPHLEVVTIVELFQDRIRDQHNAVVELLGSGEYGALFDYETLSEDQLKAYDEAGVRRLCEIERQRIADRAATGGSVDAANQEPTRISVEQVEGSFWFSALTATASIPVRQVEFDPLIIDEQNNLVVAATTMDAQVKAGRILGRELVPADFRTLFASGARVVLNVDSNMARVPWELVVVDTPASGAGDDEPARDDDNLVQALDRGFTRQLRTKFAPTPEPLPTPRRLLCALVVADPAPDAPLAGARAEAFEVVQVFEAFNKLATGDRIQVTALIGPGAATRSRVLGELLDGRYDLLHYSGHCFFDPAAPQACGWLFARGATAAKRRVLAARELRRVDRLPRFVFSNACESGVMPFRPEGRSSALTPAFAETFFERGVNNFVCTGWPVGDAPARLFARVFYGAMLGLELTEDNGRLVAEKVATGPVDLAEALRRARVEVRKLPGGLRTWGAYQHYGNPFTRFLAGRVEGPAPMRTAELRPRLFPAGPSTGPAAPQGGGEAPPPPGPASSIARVEDVIKRRGDELRQIPGVVDVRPGYRFEDDWITNEPAVVLAVVGTPAPGAVPDQIDGVPIDVAPADPFEQVIGNVELRSASPSIEPRRFLLPGEAPVIQEERALTAYQPPPGETLDEVEDDMTVNCHVSPDCGWPVLSGFLSGVSKTLTVAMYDFTAPHVRDAVRAAVKPRTRSLKLVLDPQIALSDGGSDDNPKANDLPEDDVVDSLKKAIGARFDFVWAAVTSRGKVHDGIFPKAYHIKVAVRDGSSFWLSSGNWQSSNQPPDDVVPAASDAAVDLKAVLAKYNREWHAVVENQGLAQIFEQFISWDLDQAKPLQVGGERGLEAVQLPDLLVPIAEDVERRITEAERQKPLSVSGKVKVRPVLTPDNYPDVVEELIRSAARSIRFQNQYINIGAEVPAGFDRLLKALKAKCEDPDVQVRIILRSIGDVRKMLVALKAYGFDVANRDLFRLQPSTHTKGIVVDDTRVLVGSHNWSGPGTTRNRDASLLFDHAGIARYYAAVFDHDWKNLANAKVPSFRDMPRVASPTRDVTTPPGFARIPWDAYFEDVDDL